MRANTPRNTLRSQEREWRMAPNQILVAAHPLIAGALATLGANFADSSEPIAEHRWFYAIGFPVALALWFCASRGML